MVSIAPVQQRIERGPPDRIALSVDPTLKPWKPEDDIIEEFYFDDELTRQFYREKVECEKLTELLIPIVGLVMCCCIFVERCYADVNAADFAYSRWVAVSKENVYIVRRKRKTQLRFYCQDASESRKTIMINNVQDIMILEPAGTAVGCFVPNVLSGVQIETAGSHGGADALTDPSLGLLAGLKDAQRFRNVVLGLKKGVYIQPSGAPLTIGAPPAVDSLGRTLGGPFPAVGTSVVGDLKASQAIDALAASAASSGSKVEALLGAMLTTLQSIDQKLSYAKVVSA